MEFEEVVETRKSFHSFTDEEVEREKIDRAVELARRSPSAWNLQPWHLKILETECEKEEAFESSFDQEFLKDADKVLVVLGDREMDSYADRAFRDAVEKGYYTEKHAEESKSRVESYSERDDEWITRFLERNCMFFASSLILALWNQGIGSCPVKGFNAETLANSMGTKEELEPLLMIPVGYPDEDKEKKWRRDVEDIIMD